jgi:hypothetical protein
MPRLLGSQVSPSDAVGLKDDPEQLSGGIIGIEASPAFSSSSSLAELIETPFSSSSRAFDGFNSPRKNTNTRSKAKANIIVVLSFTLFALVLQHNESYPLLHSGP